MKNDEANEKKNGTNQKVQWLANQITTIIIIMESNLISNTNKI